MNFKLVLGPLVGWRTVSKLAVRKSPENKVIIGLFTPKSHSILSIPNCPAHHPSINYATNALQLACESCGVAPYDEHTGKGNLRYVCINVERITGKTQITLVWNMEKKIDLTTQDDDDKLDELLEKIIAMGNGPTEKDKGENSFSLHSLWVHRNTAWKHSNAIFDITAPMSDGENASWKLAFGPAKIDECIMPSSKKSNLKCPPYTIKLQFPPNVFRQANIDAFAKIVERIRERVLEYNKHFASSNKDEKDKHIVNLPFILELYGGVGTIGLHLADLASSITCSDENIHNPKCFENAVSHCMPSDIAKNCNYVRKNAADMVMHDSGAYVRKADIIIVDPPRKGLDETVINALMEKKGPSPKMLIYVSCGFDAFQKNCKRLEEGGWILEYAEGHILFPGSDAIETLAFFVR